MVKQHELKTVNPWFTDIWEGHKSFEYRLNDREFNAGDTLVLREWVNMAYMGYTGREVRADVTYIYNCGDGYCVMQLEVTAKQDVPEAETIRIDMLAFGARTDDDPCYVPVRPDQTATIVYRNRSVRGIDENAYVYVVYRNRSVRAKESFFVPA